MEPTGFTEPTRHGSVRAVVDVFRAALTRERGQRSVRVLVGGAATLMICLLAGFMIGTSASVAKGTDLRGGRATDMVSMVREESMSNAMLAEEVSAVREEVDRLGTATGRSGVPAEDLEAAASDAQTMPVTGPGVTVVLADAPSSVVIPDVDQDLLVVHQQDIQAVVNALWQGGAEAMTIQGQRIISTTGIKCVGNTVVLQGIPYAPPYRIQAIGDPNALEAALASSTYVQTYKQYVTVYGLEYQERREAHLSFPAFAGGIELQYARPA